jgi:chromosome segregation protein
MQAKIESALAQLEGNRERSRQLADEEQRLNLELEEFRAERTRIAEQVEATGAQLADLEEAFQAAERAYQHTRGDLDAARTAAVESNKILAQRSARFHAVRQLVESGEGFEKGTQNVLQGLGNPDQFKPTIHGALASFIEADNTCARAIEAALGTHLHAVLVHDQAAAEAIIGRLTEKQLGVAAILPESFVPHSAGTQMEALPEGATAWALDRIKSDKRVSGVIERLLERVLIVPNLSTALRLRANHPGVTFVTLAGVMLSGEGMLRGGATAEGTTSVLELRNEVRALEAEVIGLTEADEAARNRVTELEAQLERLREEVEVSRERLQRQKVELSTLQGQLSLATREVENFETKAENVRWERGELENRERAAAEGREHLESELASSRDRLESLESENRRLQSEADAAVHREQDLNTALNELRTDLAVERRSKQSAEELQKPMEARLSELREISIRRETEIEAFTQRIEGAIAENARLAEECETHRAEVEDLQVEINTRSEGRTVLLEAIETAETQLAAVRRDHAKVNEQKGREEVAATKLDLRLESLTNSIQERYQIDLSTFEPDAHALLASIASQKALQSRGGRQVIVEGDSSDTSEQSDDDDMPTMVVDGTSDDDENIEIPGEMTGEPDWDFVESIVTDIKRRLDAMGPSTSMPSRNSKNSKKDITSSRTNTTTSFPRKPSCSKSSTASTRKPSASSRKPSPRSKSTSARCSRNSSAKKARPTSPCWTKAIRWNPASKSPPSHPARSCNPSRCFPVASAP